MLGRRPLLLVAVAAAAFIPYWLSEHKTPSSASWWDAMWTDSLDDAAQGDGRWPIASSSPAADYTSRGAAYGPAGPPWASAAGSTDPATGGPSLTGPPGQSLAELFRFDVTSAWIMNRWSRVSTGLIDEDLEGMRVTVVSGTGNYDIAGSITYYFDRHYQVQRISFNGFTPDPAQIVDFAMRYYGLRPEPMLGAGLFLQREGEHWLHAMRIQHAPVVRANTPHRRYSVIVELNRPGSGRKISSQLTSLLESDRRARLWQSADSDATNATPRTDAPASAPQN